MTHLNDALPARRTSRPIAPENVRIHSRQDPVRSVARMSWAAYSACTLAFGHAGISVYWALGGTGGLGTVGGFAERWARSPSTATLIIVWATVVLKALGGFLALALVRPWGARLPRSWVVLLGTAAAALLMLYGGVLVLSAALVETGALRAATPIDWRGLRWHLGLWDLWFLIWGILLGIAVWRFYRSHRSPKPRAVPGGGSDNDR